jgi:hypothetical protein
MSDNEKGGLMSIVMALATPWIASVIHRHTSLNVAQCFWLAIFPLGLITLFLFRARTSKWFFGLYILLSATMFVVAGYFPKVFSF